MQKNEKKNSTKLIRCPVCEAVNIDKPGDIYCHRCQSRIYRDIKYSTSKAWAFLITALILYLPANIYPILLNQKFYSHGANTIMGGVILLWNEGSYPVALVIFVASIVVPILKFIVLIYLLINASIKKYKYTKRDLHRLHRMTEIIGPWSMVDVFVVALLTGLVHLNHIKVIAGPAATAFVLMVIFTMLSALSLDVRIFNSRREDV